jgi:hypothetical protein
MLFLLCSEKYSWFLEHSTIGRVSVLNFGRSGIDGKQKQAIDQGRLGASRLFQKFRDLQLVEAAMLGSLPFNDEPAGVWFPRQRQDTTNPDRSGQAHANSRRIYD